MVALGAGGVEEGSARGFVTSFPLCSGQCFCWGLGSFHLSAPTGHLQPGVLGSGDSSPSARPPDLEAVLAAGCGCCLSVS